MKIREFLKFYLGYNSFQVVSESGDRWTDVLSKEEVLKSFENAELKRTDIDGEEYECWTYEKTPEGSDKPEWLREGPHLKEEYEFWREDDKED